MTRSTFAGAILFTAATVIVTIGVLWRLVSTDHTAERMAPLVAPMPAMATAHVRPEGKWGYPTPPEAFHPSYVRGHNGAFGTEWVCEYLVSESLAKNADRAGLDFRADPDVPHEWRARRETYRELNGDDERDIGHLANAADASYSEKALAETFLLSNAVPQRPSMNRGAWKALEDHLRELASQDGAELWIFTGPAWPADHKGEIHVKAFGNPPVIDPVACWKAVLVQHDDKRYGYAWLMPNAEGLKTFEHYAVTFDAVEAVAGLNLFSGLDDEEEERLEAKLP